MNSPRVKFYIAKSGKTPDLSTIHMKGLIESGDSAEMMRAGYDLHTWMINNLAYQEYDGFLAALSDYHKDKLNKYIETSAKYFHNKLGEK
jgi:hypothetical protein